MLGLLGFLAAYIPRLVSIWENRIAERREQRDHERELELRKLEHECELARIEAGVPEQPVNSVEDLLSVDLSDLKEARQDTIDVIDRSKGWVRQVLTFWNGQVRPTVAMGAMAVYCYLLIITEGQLIFQSTLHDDILFFIITFYYGGRAMLREKSAITKR